MSLRDGYEEETGGAGGVSSMNGGDVNGRNSKKAMSFPTGQLWHHTLVSFTENMFLGEADIKMPGFN